MEEQLERKGKIELKMEKTRDELGEFHIEVRLKIHVIRMEEDLTGNGNTIRRKKNQRKTNEN